MHEHATLRLIASIDKRIVDVKTSRVSINMDKNIQFIKSALAKKAENRENILAHNATVTDMVARVGVLNNALDLQSKLQILAEHCHKLRSQNNELGDKNQVLVNDQKNSVVAREEAEVSHDNIFPS